VRFGIGLGRTLTADGAAQLAKVADEYDYEHCTFIDSQNLCRDSSAMMTLAAANTTRIRIGHAVTNPYTRHAAVIANSIGTLDEISDGRAFLGIGAGGSAVAMVGQHPRPLSELADHIAFFRDFTAGRQASWQGQVMRSEWLRRYIPVVIGTHGAKSCRLAGRIADGVFLPGFDPGIARWKRARVAEGANQVGRGLADLRLWCRGAVFVHEDMDYAREYVRSYAATSAYYLWRSVLRFDTDERRALAEDLPTAVLEEMVKLADRYDFSQHETVGAAHAADLSDRLIDCFAIYGPPGRCVERLEQLRALGVDRASLVLYGVPDQAAMIRRFVEDVAARLG